MSSTNEQLTGDKAYPNGYLVMPNEAFNKKEYEHTYIDEEGNPQTVLVSMNEFAELTGKTVIPMKDGLYSFLPLELSFNKKHHDKILSSIIKHEYSDGKEDYASTDNSLCFTLNYGEFIEFMKITPHNIGE